MFWNGVYLDDFKTNRLFQLHAERNYYSLTELLKKPKRWEASIKLKPEAITQLRYEIIKPIPDNFFDDLCPDFMQFKRLSQSPESVWMLGERVSIAYIIVAFENKFKWLNIPVEKISDLIDSEPIACPKN